MEYGKPIQDVQCSFLLITSFLLFDLSKTLLDSRRGGNALKIASFNVQIFGAKKMENQMVKDVLIKVGLGIAATSIYSVCLLFSLDNVFALYICLQKMSFRISLDL